MKKQHVQLSKDDGSGENPLIKMTQTPLQQLPQRAIQSLKERGVKGLWQDIFDYMRWLRQQ
jgi:hypothetical protein